MSVVGAAVHGTAIAGHLRANTAGARKFRSPRSDRGLPPAELPRLEGPPAHARSPQPTSRRTCWKRADGRRHRRPRAASAGCVASNRMSEGSTRKEGPTGASVPARRAVSVTVFCRAFGGVVNERLDEIIVPGLGAARVIENMRLSQKLPGRGDTRAARWPVTLAVAGVIAAQACGGFIESGNGVVRLTVDERGGSLSIDRGGRRRRLGLPGTSRRGTRRWPRARAPRGTKSRAPPRPRTAHRHRSRFRSPP